MTALVVRGDALSLPLHSNSVDLIVTSPPYFALRSYQTGHEMEVGSEEAYCHLATDQTLQRWRAGKVAGRLNRERQGSLL